MEHQNATYTSVSKEEITDRGEQAQLRICKNQAPICNINLLF